MKPAKPSSATMDEQTFIPPTMRALYYTPLPTIPNDPTAVSSQTSITFDTDFPVPKPSPAQYLIKVQTTAFSQDEVRLAGLLNPTQSMPQIPLHNLCGTVISTPSQDHWNAEGPKFKVDDVVFGLVSYSRDGAAADYVLAYEDELAFKPKNISAAEAATIPLPALTAWQAIFTYAGLDDNPDRNASNGKRKNLRVLVTNAYNNEVGMQAIQLLRSKSLFPNQHRPWICVTCSSSEQETALRQNHHVDETIVAPLPIDPSFDLATSFRSNRWDPVDIVLDCADGLLFHQAHSPHVVKNHGSVLTAVDSTPAQTQQHTEKNEKSKRDLFSRFIAVEPDGHALGKIARLVEEEQAPRGRAESIVDLVNGADILDAGAAGANGARRGGMFVVRVN